MKTLKKSLFVLLAISLIPFSSFVSASYGDAVTLYSPKESTSVASQKPTIKWNSMTGATGYFYKIATSYAGLDGAGENNVGNVLQHTFSSNLTNDQVYYWKVKSDNGAYSSSRWFKVDTTLANSAIQVESITGIRTTGVVGGDYSNGWQFRFKATVYGAENLYRFRLSDWTRNGGGTMAVANNAKVVYSGTEKFIGAANTYTDTFTISDGDDTVEGKQITFDLYVKIPAGTQAGTYSANYGIKSE